MIVSRLQRGVSLVELMIGMVLALIITGGVVAIFVGASGTFNLNRQLDRSQEGLRFVVTYLSHELRQATRVPDDGVNSALTPISVVPDSADVTQTITVRYPVVNLGDAVHCNGDPVPGDTLLEKSFFVENGTLRCQSGVRVRSPSSDTLTLQNAVNVMPGVRRLRIQEWIESAVAPNAYVLLTRTSMADLESDEGLGLVGVRFLVEKDHIEGQTQTFVITAALRNTVLQWFTIRP